MTIPARLFRGALVILACVSLGGCMPSGRSQVEEEKEPHFMAGKTAINGMDYRGAIEEFEKALEINPRSASAHFELAWLYDEKESDPAAAIYHYEQFLKCRPGADNAEIVRQRVYRCKQDLAKGILPLPGVPGMQQELEQLAAENRQLREELEKWRAYFKTLPTNQPAVTVTRSPAEVAVQATPPSDPPAQEVRSSARPERKHVVQAGETPYSIARKYGLRPDALLDANPGLDPRRLRVGQTLNVPTP